MKIGNKDRLPSIFLVKIICFRYQKRNTIHLCTTIPLESENGSVAVSKKIVLHVKVLSGIEVHELFSGVSFPECVFSTFLFWKNRVACLAI